MRTLHVPALELVTTDDAMSLTEVDGTWRLTLVDGGVTVVDAEPLDWWALDDGDADLWLRPTELRP